MAVGRSLLGLRAPSSLLSLLALPPLLALLGLAAPGTASLIPGVSITLTNSYPNPFFTNYTSFEYTICNNSPTALAFPRLTCPPDMNFFLSVGINFDCGIPITIWPNQRYKFVIVKKNTDVSVIDFPADAFAASSFTFDASGSKISIACGLETVTFGGGDGDFSYRYGCVVSNGYPLGVAKVSMFCLNFHPTAWASITPDNTCSLVTVPAGKNSYRFWYESGPANVVMKVVRVHNI